MPAVALIGLRATGKTTVGQQLARRLQVTWIDTDQEVVRRAGHDIARFFAERRESDFRDLEAAVISDLSDGQPRVVSLGGGAVLRADNREQICRWGPVVWLHADTQTLVRRMLADPQTPAQRPRLTELELEAEMATLQTQREPLYRQCATWDFDTGRLPPEEIVQSVLNRLGPDFPVPPGGRCE